MLGVRGQNWRCWLFCSVEEIEGGRNRDRAGSNSVKNTVSGSQNFWRRQQESVLLVRKFKKKNPFDSGKSAKPVVATSRADVHRVGARSDLKSWKQKFLLIWISIGVWTYLVLYYKSFYLLKSLFNLFLQCHCVTLYYKSTHFVNVVCIYFSFLLLLNFIQFFW